MKSSGSVESDRHKNGAMSPEEVSDARLIWSAVVNLALTVFEAVVGLLAGSLMLLADALHNLNDCASLLIALVARRIARRKADRRFTFGYKRAELIGAMINITTLVIVGLYLVYEAVVRFIAPKPVQGGLVMIAAGVALIVDVATAALLWAMARGSLNVRAAFVHNLSDAFSSVAVLIGGAVILAWGWTIVDPILTITIAGYVMIHGSGMFRRTASILMGGSPPDVDMDKLIAALGATDRVVDVHHVHVWELDEDKRAMEAHVVIPSTCASDLETIKQRLKNLLKTQFGIEHCTLEFDLASERDQSNCGDSGKLYH
jgi:cobalt-zinc-cadmium efflux system protein